jgi:hypothetical protein
MLFQSAADVRLSSIQDNASIDRSGRRVQWDIVKPQCFFGCVGPRSSRIEERANRSIFPV